MRCHLLWELVVWIGAFGAITAEATEQGSCRRVRCVESQGAPWPEFNKTQRFTEAWRGLSARSCLSSAAWTSPTPASRRSLYVRRHMRRLLLDTSSLSDTHWQEYKSVYNKSFDAVEHEDAALAAWRHNLEYAAAHNRDYLAGAHSYSLHPNHFADMSLEEYLKRVLKLIRGKKVHYPNRDGQTRALHASPQATPLSLDWRTKGYRPRLEEQWRCGACYAFAVTHAIQAHAIRSKGDNRDLSVQQLVDCSGGDGNQGCGGGSLEGALRYAARMGLEPEAEYPYTGKAGTCRYRSTAARTKVSRWGVTPAGDEAAIARTLAHIGPLAVAINAAPRTFALYRSGIYDDPNCHSNEVNHAMLLVGYTPQYWLLMNWWGVHWGEQGYMRLRRGVNRCGIANHAAYVEL